ncbi:phage holin family protein [Oceanobacillus luteolus]|uniref:Phage holin family protein n=1 Tax=Oceanobacillus luteolus TaxID=1274358 RepID=A0ABW4HQM9_9BACI|nr:phage holin family protein [Oceanobacillus luteolus]
MRFLISLALNTVALLIVDQLFTSFHIDGIGTAILASIILAILNVLLKPLLIILTLPITILTFGLFLIVINAITLMVTQALIGSSFVIDGFGTAIIASVLISLITLVLGSLVKDK